MPFILLITGKGWIKKKTNLKKVYKLEVWQAEFKEQELWIVSRLTYKNIDFSTGVNDFEKSKAVA